MPENITLLPKSSPQAGNANHAPSERMVVAKKGVQGLWKDLPVPSADLSEVSWAK